MKMKREDASADIDGGGRAEPIAASLIDDVVVVVSPPQ
jgi:hypothetical protein